ncbi:MAG: SurA N-terminal domain-containing protein [Bacteroidota bacterium]|nr:SurA N-terminal domain-containing protein [Bacteroidota bacterium]
MTILSRIRNRVGLLVGIIFLALLAFVLGDVFSARIGLGGGNDNTVGEINGNEISAVDFSNELTEKSNDQNLNTDQQDQLSQMIWEEKLRKYIFEPQFNALGITITEDELADQMMGNNMSPYMTRYFQNQQTGEIDQQVAGANGQLDPEKVRTFVNGMDAEKEATWARIEDDMKIILIREKYNTLLRKGFYATAAETKREYADENTKYNYKYILKKYTDIADSLVTPSTEEMKDYYTNHEWKFKQAEAVRTIEYVAFNISPTADDIAAQKKEMTDLVPKFQEIKPEGDSLFVLQNSESGIFAKSFMHPGQFPAGTDSAFIKANTGDVLGPFVVGENLVVYKVYDKENSIDSVKVRHILVAHKEVDRPSPGITRTKVQSKMRADSILRVVKSGKTKMEDIVEKLTDDPGSKPQGPQPGNKGDYGWISKETPFVQEFKDAGFNNPKGATVVVETDFGYHVIQVIEKSSESTKVRVAAIDKKMEPSDATMRDIYNKASEFAGKNNTPEAFAEAVKKDNLATFQSPDININIKVIDGFENPKEVVRWLFDPKTEVGTVSEPFQNTTRYLVARVTSVLERGVKPFEDKTVQEICKVEATKQKKADKFTEEFNKAKGATLEETAAKMNNLPVMPGANVTIAQPSMQGATFEPGVVGVLTSLAPGAISAPVKGSLGVYVVKLETVVKPAAITPEEAKAKQASLIMNMASRADQSAEGVLKDAADIVDDRARHF